MDQYLKLLTENQAPGWVIICSISARLLAMDKIIRSLYEDLIKPSFRRKDELVRDQIANYVSDAATGDILYARYISVARHLIDTSWNVLGDVRDGNIEPEKILDRLRVRSADAVDAAKRSLKRYRSYSTRRSLSLHLSNLTESRWIEFYGPIVAEVIQLSEYDSRNGYESLRLVILKETDHLISEATDEILNDKNINPKKDEL